jgi:hypothetical protein
MVAIFGHITITRTVLSAEIIPDMVFDSVIAAAAHNGFDEFFSAPKPENLLQNLLQFKYARVCM